MIQLAREIDGLLRLPDFARKFVNRAVELTGARPVPWLYSGWTIPDRCAPSCRPRRKPDPRYRLAKTLRIRIIQFMIV